MRELIINADDFGLATPVNEAVERAHAEGVLTSASLMAAGPAFDDAVERARRLPELHVGLHVVVTNGRPALPPEEVPDLVDERGALSGALGAAGVRYFFLPRVRQQLEREIRAQFDAFRRTGLALDHVNAHNHMHVHPTVLGLILKIGREYGMRAVRTPYEPGAMPVIARPWLRALRRRLRRTGIVTNDCVLGLRDTGAMDENRVVALLGRLGDGITEMYFHPAVSRPEELVHAMPDYQHEAEFAALVSPRVAEAVRASAARLVAYSTVGHR